MARKQARSETDWNKILEEAGQIKTLKLLDTLALMRLVTSRAPETMKSFLLQRSLKPVPGQTLLKTRKKQVGSHLKIAKTF
ncbi:hypothetical protein GVAV_000909 [Gurleya vavrai]